MTDDGLTQNSRKNSHSFRHALLQLGLLVACSALAFGQISPGALSRAHQSLNGSKGCTSCHAVAAGSPNFRCLDCHREIAQRLSAGRGYHATIVQQKNSSQECVRCHSEHNGEDFSLIRWQPRIESFDHSKTGFALAGKHAGQACQKCHTAQRVQAAERASIAIKDPNRTFLGLSRECATCHEDKHRGQLGADCQRCHNAAEWKTAREFDHSKARFALTGAHARVACQKCHTTTVGETQRFKGIAFALCSNCHNDPHKGSFEQRCESCHNTAAWKQVSVAGKFDHSRTKFLLEGKHKDVSCAACHRAGDFKKPVAHALCADCHKPDPHNGQFAARADGGRCESCHTVAGFKPAKFDKTEHGKTGFPLRGKHASVECAKCHTPAGKATRFKVKFTRCADCHEDGHQGQFAREPFLNQCEKCHTEDAYRPSTFTVARHQQSRFVLANSHLAIACNECHKASREQQGKHPAVKYRYNTMDCTECHADPHKGQFRDRIARLSADGKPAGCQACHSTKTWSDLAGFDHSATNFALLGAHRATACVGCHRPPNLETRLKNVDFRSAPSRCEDCHQDVHAGQFAGADRVTRCAECHTANRWRPSLFDHERKTKFSLAGAHMNVQCRRCHASFKDVEGRPVLFYKPTPTTCAACHGTQATPVP